MALTLSNSTVPLSPLSTLNENHKLHSCVHIKDLVTRSQESVWICGASSVNRKGTDVISYGDGGENGGGNSGEDVLEELKTFWDDGYGTQTIKDCAVAAMDLITTSDKGPPRWFCPVTCGKPFKDSPLLLYLPGIDGTGTGLGVHIKSLGKVFRVQCLHIPVWDRTPLEGLIEIVEEMMMIEHTLSPNKPIYLLGDSFGGALALAIAARNSTTDLILILANPATSYEKTMIHPLMSVIKSLPEEHYGIFPYAISPFFGNYIKMAMVRSTGRNHMQTLSELPANIRNDLPSLTSLARIVPKDTLAWRLKLVESAAAYANSRLHAITAQVLVIASGNDYMLPSKYEAQRLSRLLKHCEVRLFEENGHTILLESDVNVLSVIKATHMYRRFSKHDILKDFISLSITEFKTSAVDTWWYRLAMGAALFSTMEDGKIVRGLAGIPDEGPVLIVGNHMLMAFDSFPLVMEFHREKKYVLHSLTHPELFNINAEHEDVMIPVTDIMKLGGAIPVSGRNFFRLLAKKSHVLLYPGGVREALHRKGEIGKLFWPEKQEFVRMAVKYGATIIPYGGVGEDDILELIVDYNDIKKIPFLNLMWTAYNQGRKNLREGMGGEIAQQHFHMPYFLPKRPGRVYYLFGKPIITKGKEHMSNDKDYLQELYSQIKCDVKNNMAYLLKKREEDPYRDIVDRFVWLMINGTLDQIPSFET
ncbi:phytyl ester synthase 1, chloroplastic-like [Rutidosis leptorrhynchoides]|uniref:phytyl ester synthase 1, chloroplastic-like n=1 Tax=Rutidosis leptorrhynchoides TaxID=125765 RepID=UPI003A998222